MLRILLVFVWVWFSFTSLASGQEPKKESKKELELTNISLTFSERKALSPDVLTLGVNLSVTGATEIEALNLLEEVDKQVRKTKVDYKGGRYSVYKNCWWEKEKRKCSGYKGDMSYIFEFTDPKAQVEIIEALEEVKTKYGEKISYSLYNPEWIVSPKTIREAEENLKLEIIDTILNFTKRLETKLKKTCFISHINYGIDRPMFEIYRPGVLKSGAFERTSPEPPQPKKEDKEIQIKVLTDIVCK